VAGVNPDDILRNFQLFAPNSSGRPEDLARLTVQAANLTFPLLVFLLHEIGGSRIDRVVPIETLCGDAASRERARRLKRSFDRHGSDKATAHNYHHFYARALTNPEVVTAVLEIGLGTNNDDAVSNMTRSGRPGASLRAFRDFLPKATIHGADIDAGILFEEERISTFRVDQTDIRSLDELGRRVAAGYDLIVDDGLHSPDANIATLAFALKRLKPGGWFVVEDVPDRTLPVWWVVAALLPNRYVPQIIGAEGGNLFAVQHAAGDRSLPAG
jgi:hypothetical protein